MKRKPTLYILFLVLIASLMACSTEIELNNHPKSQTAVVRIMTVINTSNTKSDLASDAFKASKAAGEIQEGTDPNDYEEGEENGKENENKVGTIRLFAFDAINGSVVKNILFRAPGATVSGDEKNFTFADGTITNIYLDMEIMPGNYKFVLVANEETAWNIGSITTYSQLTSSPALSDFTNPIITEIDLTDKVTNKSGIPMIGESAIKVLPDANATAENPQVVAPKIKLKRTIAKVEVSIKNTDDNGNIIETAKPYRIKSVELINADQRYNVFEENNTSISSHSWTSANNVLHNAGDIINKNILTNYIVETEEVDEAEATTVRIITEAIGQEYAYDIPLFQYEDAARIKKNYDIRRNTIYRLGTKLIGKELGIELNVYTEVEGWVTVNEAVVDVNDPHVEHILNVDRKIIYVTPAASGTHTETITFFTDLEYIDHSAPDIAGLIVDEGELNAGTHAFALTIPQTAVRDGSKSIKFDFGLNGEKKVDITIMVKPKQ